MGVVWKLWKGWVDHIKKKVALARSSVQGCWVFVTNKESTEARQEQRQGKKRGDKERPCCPFVMYIKNMWGGGVE